jgi:hypothetical protein
MLIPTFLRPTAVLTLLLSVLTFAASAQTPSQPADIAPVPPTDSFKPHTLAGDGVGHHGFFVAPAVQLGPAQGDARLWVGGRVAYQVNHRVALGFGGFGLATEPRVYDLAGAPVGSRPRLSGGYGGFLVEYTVAPAALVHVSFPVIVGAGGAGYSWNGLLNPNDDPDDRMHKDDFYDADAFFVIEPGVQAELNLTSFLRLTAGASYRYVDGLKLERTTSADLSGITVSVGLKGGLL